jgi:hypothetical protein
MSRNTTEDMPQGLEGTRGETSDPEPLTPNPLFKLSRFARNDNALNSQFPNPLIQ